MINNTTCVILTSPSLRCLICKTGFVQKTRTCIPVFVPNTAFGINIPYFVQYGHLMQRTDSGKDPGKGCERSKAGGKGENKGWDGWMASPTGWTWVWASSEIGDGQGSLECYSTWCYQLASNHPWAYKKLNKKPIIFTFSVQFSHSFISDILWPHGLQHNRLPCPSPTPRAYSNSCPSHWWCHPTISSSVAPFSFYLQSLPASGSFQMSQFFTSDDQSIGVSASASVLAMNIQDWFPLGWIGWISLQSKGLSRVFFNTTVQKHQFFGTQLSL